MSTNNKAKRLSAHDLVPTFSVESTNTETTSQESFYSARDEITDEESSQETKDQLNNRNLFAPIQPPFSNLSNARSSIAYSLTSVYHSVDDGEYSPSISSFPAEKTNSPNRNHHRIGSSISTVEDFKTATLTKNKPPTVFDINRNSFIGEGDTSSTSFLLSSKGSRSQFSKVMALREKISDSTISSYNSGM